MRDLLGETSALLAFVRSVESGSFTAAARLLGTTPSATSRSISRLEERIGARLFMRSTRALSLTPDGQLFFERVAPLLKELANAGDVLSRGMSGRLKISIPAELSVTLVDPILDRLAKPNPDLHLEIGISDRFVDLIREDYDVAFRVGRLPSSDLSARKIADMEMVIVASPELYLSRGEPRTIRDLALFPFARYVSTTKPFEITFENGSAIAPPGTVDCDTGYGLHRAALHGLGAAYLMRRIASRDIEEGRLVAIEVESALPALPLSAVHAFGHRPPHKVTVLCDLIAEEVRSARRGTN
ncbi:LysR family transcriptional regulator [Rhizobium sp. Leaf383]|uniref:LysR family transcriptional regulator n=1 Tax=Rhizobium sp. Leaf383 TaxID=1736357 RepID=UPI00071488FC|nr:LysR family transcriptional regulator [Rhizobium sp. Leaf383]KQS76405.1 LysR family transcriptional regulator [Rhizobium sp. Leaf383]